VPFPEQPTKPAPQQVTAPKWRGGPDMPAVVRASISSAYVTLMFADGSGLGYRNVDARGTDLVLADQQTGRSAGKLQVTFPQEDRMVLEGSIEGQQVRMTLRKIVIEKKTFLLRTRGFNWIQDKPYNR
jgi:hypothetical protein